jgi:hypothetical protein
MESLDFNALCNIASFLDLDSFRAFIRNCRAFAACRHDVRTLAHVALNTNIIGISSECLVFSQFGSTAIRFFAERCCDDMGHACHSAIWVATRQKNYRALSILAPLCDRLGVEDTLEECRLDLPFLVEALNYLDVPPDVHGSFFSEMTANDINAFDAIRRFDRTGEIPTDVDEFVIVAEEIMISGHIGWLERMVLALEETDASGSLKAGNVHRVVALLETLHDFGILVFFDSIEDEQFVAYSELLTLFRPYIDIAARLFAIAPRPLTLAHQLGMIQVFFYGGDFDRIKALYSRSNAEAQLVNSLSSYCCESLDCAYTAQQRRLKVMTLPHLSSPLTVDTRDVIAECILIDTNFEYDPIFKLLADLDSGDAGPTMLADNAPPGEDDFTPAGTSRMIMLALRHFKLRDQLDVRAIIDELFSIIAVINLGRTCALAIFILLYKNGLFANKDASIPDLFCRNYSKQYWDEDYYVDSRAAISASAFSDFLLAVCREHAENVNGRDMKSENQFQQFIGLLRQFWPTEFDACWEDCLRIAAEHDDPMLISLINYAAKTAN